MSLRLLQLLGPDGERLVAASTSGTTARRVAGATSVYALANEAIEANTTLSKLLDAKGYGEDIDLCYRAWRAGWSCWYVPAAVVEHEHQAVTDHRLLTRRTLWHWRGILRFVRKHPERLISR